MSVKLRASSGSYNVRASELNSQTQRPNITKTVHCIVFFLDNTQEAFHIDVSVYKLYFFLSYSYSVEHAIFHPFQWLYLEDVCRS